MGGLKQLKIGKSHTDRSEISVDKYLLEIGKIPLITVEEEVELAKKIRKGDNAALDRLVNANLRFVVSVAKKYQHQGLSLSDLINEGNLGLITAAQKYDETRGFKFISYAVWWIRQQMLQALAEQSRIVRLPLNQVGGINKTYRVQKKFVQEHEREPTDEELAKLLDKSEVKVKDYRIEGKHTSLDADAYSEDPGVTKMDLLSDTSPVNETDSGLISESLSFELKKALSLLPQREKEILEMYFGFTDEGEISYEEIGKRLGLTRERVRQIKEKALFHLRKKLIPRSDINLQAYFEHLIP